MRKMIPLAVALLGGSLALFAQEENAPPDAVDGGWRRFGGEAQAVPNTPPPPASNMPSPAEPNAAAPAGPAAQLTLPAGTWITVRVDQELSSDRSAAGDAFTASLAQPLVANGFVVARRGQMVGGRVVEAVKAGKAKGTSRLAVELTEVGLVDGRQVPVRTRLTEQKAGTSVGRDVGAVATTAGVGAAIGATADGGFGAGVGALAGAAAGMIGVMTTRGKATVIYPEMLLTFRLEEPLAISTESSAQAFLPVAPSDYAQNAPTQPRRVAKAPARYYYGGWDWWYGPYYRPWFYGPSIRIYTGPRFFGHRGRR